VNGILINKINPNDELYLQLEKIYSDKSLLENLGTELNKTVLGTFSIDPIISQHEDLIKNISGK
jgi:hypothetical protein